jgi:hypothetical protein
MVGVCLAFARLGGPPPVLAAEKQGAHDHTTPSRSFGSLAEGMSAVDATLKQTEAAIAANKIASLHDLGMELHAVADGLAAHKQHVPEAKQTRFEGAVNQLRTIGDRMHDVPATAPLADAQKLAAQARGIEKILQANAN